MTHPVSFPFPRGWGWPGKSPPEPQGDNNRKPRPRPHPDFPGQRGPEAPLYPNTHAHTHTQRQTDRETQRETNTQTAGNRIREVGRPREDSHGDEGEDDGGEGLCALGTVGLRELLGLTLHPA